MYATMDEEVDNIEALSINQNISYPMYNPIY